MNLRSISIIGILGYMVGILTDACTELYVFVFSAGAAPNIFISPVLLPILSVGEKYCAKIKSIFLKKLLTNDSRCGIIYIVAEIKRRRHQADGSIAQLGEHLPYKQRVIGSSPITSTNMAR